MSTASILGILFILELVIVGFGLSGFLFLKLRRLKREVADRAAERGNHSGGTLHDLLEEKITETRNKIAEKSPTQTEQEHKAENAVLEQRIEYLKLEKELLDDSIDNDNFWNKIYNRLSTILTAMSSDDMAAAEGAETSEDSSSLRRRLSKYKDLLSRIIQEFRDYRKKARKLADSFSPQPEDKQASEAIQQSLAAFNKTDEEIRQRLDTYQQDLAADSERRGTDTVTVGRVSTDFTPAKASEEEIKRLQQIIGRQYESLDELKKALHNADSAGVNTGDMSKKLELVERSQQELQTCIEVLEMENQRLGQELANALQQLEGGENQQQPKEHTALRRKNSELEEQLSDTRDKLKAMEKDYNSLQEEFMRIYNKDKQ